MDTYSAWAGGRPVLSRLPGINDSYTGNEVADWLTDYPDSLLVGTKAKIDDLPRQLDPDNCDADWLDYLAPLCGWHGEYWDRAWPVTAKRTLLRNSYTLIWPSKGSQQVLSFVLTALGINHVIQQGQSFIIGVGQVGDPLGLVAWDYDIILPTSYYGRPEAKLTERINELFGPCWCSSEILYDDKYNILYEVLGYPSGNPEAPFILISTSTGVAIEV
ncbi:phage tail protein [Pseudanabaena sp. FACHB-2040]|uniref:phage tail protein n=1 Tax=Pseudanabaena sp. FACHB-2040 TaxID=2692859 RepID=UPI001685B4A6|nr:phage tail protein [Pseudanabaena sp. FACHB-2040]MBD2256642.1 hypothetical protein [Pseudanabaena sp. FACHB-2040]